MAKGFKHGAGGASLNFKVVRYDTEEQLKASTPKPNTIGVITETDITGWIFSGTEPAEPVDGLVWFVLSDRSSVEFNALKKYTMMVYPVTARQYVDGALVSVTAMTYQSGEWGYWWNGELYTPCNEHTRFTGGWIAEPKGRIASAASTAMPTVSQDEKGMAMSCSSGGIVRTVDKIDLSEYKRLRFTGDLRTSGSRDDWMRLCIWSEIGTYWNDNIKAQLSSSNTDYGTQYIDLSAIKGEYYVGFAMYSSGCLMESLVME